MHQQLGALVMLQLARLLAGKPCQLPMQEAFASNPAEFSSACPMPNNLLVMEGKRPLLVACFRLPWV
jgi:hypothetical protein